MSVMGSLSFHVAGATDEGHSGDQGAQLGRNAELSKTARANVHSGQST